MLVVSKQTKKCSSRICSEVFFPRSARQMYCSAICRHREFRVRRYLNSKKLSKTQLDIRKKQIPQHLSDKEAADWYWDNRTIVSGDCRLWVGYSNQGYGRIGRTTTSAGCKETLIHRFFYAVRVGAVAGPIHHTCGHTLCVNISHLQETTQSENTLEMLARRGYEATISELNEKILMLEETLMEIGMMIC